MNQKPLNVYTYVPQNHTASFYYRILAPLKAINDLGFPILAMVSTDSTRIPPEDNIRAFCESDVALVYQPASEAVRHNVMQVNSFIPSKRDGEWKWPPSVVVESDDNLFHVSPLNPAFRNLGTKDTTGKEIPSGHNIGVVENGERKIAWIDGHECSDECRWCNKGINLASNRQALAAYRSVINSVDAVTCSTQGVAEAIQKESTPRRVKVIPNMVRFDDYEQVDLMPSKKIKILWQGGQNHYEDWYPLRKQLGRITKKYPEIQWVIWGALYPWVMEEIPAERYTFQKWCPYQEYKLRMAMVGHSINLAPLGETPFNTCRSAIKFYESSVLKRPAVTLAQNTAAYREEIKDGETGLLFDTPDQFETCLSQLIEDATMRKDLAGNAKQWVSENRDLMKNAPEIYNFWKSLRETRKTEQPHVTEAGWAEIEKQFEAEEAAQSAKTEAQSGKMVNGAAEAQGVYAQ